MKFSMKRRIRTLLERGGWTYIGKATMIPPKDIKSQLKYGKHTRIYGFPATWDTIVTIYRYNDIPLMPTKNAKVAIEYAEKILDL